MVRVRLARNEQRAQGSDNRHGSSRTYVLAEQMAGSSGKIFDETTKTPWFAYLSGSTWRQVWYDDSLSLAWKYSLVNNRSLGGIGVWALGYDGARKPIWYGIRAAFVSAGTEVSANHYPETAVLLQNWPNPFNPTTTIRYSIGVVSSQSSVVSSRVRLAVYDLLGGRWPCWWMNRSSRENTRQHGCARMASGCTSAGSSPRCTSDEKDVAATMKSWGQLARSPVACRLFTYCLDSAAHTTHTQG